MLWRTGRYTHDLTERAMIMGILNVTPDSFSDGGSFLDVPRAVDHALSLLAEGAAIIDVGGESTRPGAPGITAAEELRRVLPVIAGMMEAAPHSVLSIDTSKAEVARAAVSAGAVIINDVTALRGDVAMAEVAAETGCGVVLMHMQGTPLTMQLAPVYQNVVQEVAAFLGERQRYAQSVGIPAECLAFDPGIGFGKTLEQNLSLLRHLEACAVPDRPTAVGISRKGFLARVTGTDDMAERLWPTLALTALLRQKGARILRVHDVRANVAALRIAEAVLSAA